MTSDRPDPVTLELLGQHADRYQAVIARMAEASLKVKALTATTVGVLVPLAVERPRAELLLIAAILVLGLAALDAHYLALERGLRATSDRLPDSVARDEGAWRLLFTIDLPRHPSSLREVAASLAAPATAAFYLLLTALLLLGWALI